MRRSLLVLAASAAFVAGCHSSSSAAPPSARACTIAPPALSDWHLHSSGTTLLDSLGRVVFLRGVNAGERSKFAPYVPFDYLDGGYADALASYMDRAASWGIDVMRVPFAWAALAPTQGTTDADWLARYQQILDAAWSRGIFTVVDFHQDIFAECFCGDGFPDWTVPDAGPPMHECQNWNLLYENDVPMQQQFDAFWADGSPVMAEYLALWQSLIPTFQNEPGVVAFEPINEPGWGTKDPGTFEGTTLSAFYASVVPMFRQAAPNELVFVEPTGFAGGFETTSLTRPPGDGIVFAPHFYPVAAHLPDRVLPGLQPWADIGTAWNVPVFIGEFGVTTTVEGIEPYIAAHFAAFDTLGMSGTLWEYSVAAEEWNFEAFSAVDSDGGEFPVAQALVRPFARAVAGSAITQSWDGTTFTLAFAPSGTAVTEVSLPARAYPTGTNVTLTGGCYDATSAPGRMLVQADGSATQVSLTVAP
jgi:endoglycosylceramidase